VERQFGHWSDAEQARFFAAQWDRGGIELILWNGAPAGYCDIEDRADDVYIHVLALHPRAQGRGIGSAILQRAIERADSRGVPVSLQVLRENRAAELYRRTGFQLSGETPTHFLMEHPGRRGGHASRVSGGVLR
jgi:GNAT superfamily N-acetyltransferase